MCHPELTRALADALALSCYGVRAQIVNVFFVLTLSGSVFNSIAGIVEKPTSIASLLATSIPTVSESPELAVKAGCVFSLRQPVPRLQTFSSLM